LRYIGRKYGLFAADEESQIKQDMFEQQLNDLSYQLVRRLLFATPPENYEREKQKFIETTLVEQLTLLSKFLESNGNKWVIGKQLTYVDFRTYQMLHLISQFHSPSIEMFPNLIQFLEKFERLPPIREYRDSSEYISWPLVGPNENFGYFPMEENTRL